MAHPQNSPRGYEGFRRLDVGSSNITYNSTGVILSAGLMISGKSAHKVTADSTGIKIGARYISTNTTGNATT